MSLSVNILADDHAGEGFSAEHGFSAFIECEGVRVLFDTGAGTTFADNARALGIPWYRADAVVLSHGHYDHTGGTEHAVTGAQYAKWYFHPEAPQMRYSRREEESPRPIGMPDNCREALKQIPKRLVHSLRPMRISQRIGVTGPIPRKDLEEEAGGPFFLDPACSIPDVIPDDQALWVRMKGGVLVVLGCAHAGVGNTLDYVADLCGERIFGVVGGLHLQGTGAVRLARAVEAFRRHGVKWIRPAHCTGEAAVTVIKRNFPDAVSSCRAGDVMKL